MKGEPSMKKTKEAQDRLGYQSTKKEYIAYCLFFLGQNLLWGYAGYIETFLTDIGIGAGVWERFPAQTNKEMIT